MKKELEQAIKEKQYWKNRCKELTEQLDAAQNPAPMLCEECQEVSCECEMPEEILNGDTSIGFSFDPKQLTIQDVLDEVLPESMNLSDTGQIANMSIQDAMKLSKSSEHVECNECDGEGQIWKDTSRSCMTAPSECCGGCGYDETCTTCSGKGTVEKEQ